MTHYPTFQHVQREVRSGVCAHCPRRTPGTDHFGPTVERPCEHGCPVFVYLPRLARVARGVDPLVGNRRNVLRRRLDALCRSEAGEASVPLRMNAADLAEAIHAAFPEARG